MDKYLTIFQISWQNEFIYRLNFILWRLRNVLRFLMTYFLWTGIFVSNKNVFGYSQQEMITYVFLVLFVYALVLSAPSGDHIGGEIGNGDLSNYLVKPVNYLKFWFTRDVASKFLNISFSIIEIGSLWLIFRPELQFQTNLTSILGFIVICFSAVLIYFFFNVSARMVAFWTPENTWGLAFLTLIFIEILAGGIFPLDILPKGIYNLLQFTPFPYLAYFPIAIFVGKITGLEMLRIIGQSFIWIALMFFVAKLVWFKGLMTYSSEGR